MKSHPTEDDPMAGELGELFRRISEQQDMVGAIITRVSAARKRYKADRSDEARRNLHRLERELDQEHRTFGKLADRAEALSGIPKEVLEALEDEAIAGDEVPRFKRVEVGGVDTTDWVEAHLSRALDRLVPKVNA